MRIESADRYGRIAAAEHRFPGEPKPMSLTLLVPLLVTFGLESVPLNSVAITVGEPFPKIVLPSIDGSTPFSIEKFRGNKVILHIFASW